MLRLTATEAARHFKAILGRVAAGEKIEVVRNGAPVAVITPPAQLSDSKPTFRDLMWSAAPIGDSFADDLRALQAELEGPPDAWAPR